MIYWKDLILYRFCVFFVVAIFGMSSCLMDRSAKMSDGFMILGILTMSLGH